MTDSGPISDGHTRPKTPQTVAQPSRENPRLAECVWPTLRLGTTKSGGASTGKKCLWDCDLVCLAQGTSNFPFSVVGYNRGPEPAQIGPTFWGKIRTKRNRKAAQMFPKWIMSMNQDTVPRWRFSQSHQAPFLPILGCFWPVVGLSRCGPKLGRQTTHTPGQNRSPKMII